MVTTVGQRRRAARNALVVAAVAVGESAVAVGRRHGLSGSRVGGIVKAAAVEDDDLRQRLVAIASQPRPPRHPDRDAAIIAAVAGGEAQVSVGRRYGLTRARVGQISLHDDTLRQALIARRSQLRPPRHPDRDAAILAMVDVTGLSREYAAKRYGITTQRVGQILAAGRLGAP
jgi:hypothetical protein